VGERAAATARSSVAALGRTAARTVGWAARPIGVPFAATGAAGCTGPAPRCEGGPAADTVARARDGRGTPPARRVVESDMATFGPRRLAAFTALWRAISRGREPGAPGLGERVRAVPRMVRGAASGRYAALGRVRLAVLGLALVYLVSPLDLIPEAFVPLFGLADDGVVALWLAGA